ncbi:MAG: PP2C family protein-serine/threonine phosphatase [Bacteroidia bacterium]
MKLIKLIDYFVPEKYINDVELSRKSKFIIWFVYITSIIGAFFGILMFYHDPNELSNLLAISVIIPLMALGLFHFRKKGSFIFSAHFFCGIFFIMMIFQPGTTGGLFSPDMPTIYIVPIFAMIMGNIRTGLFYGILCLIVLIAYFILGINEPGPFLEKSNKLTPDYFFFNLTLNLVVILFLVFRNENLRLKLLGALRESNIIISEKSKEITDSINYAKRIQTAILPDNAITKNHFPNSFFLYQPKDIVSGDFYWMAEKQGFHFLAVADCTGHGVPGALMSVIGVNHLNTIIQEKAILDTSAILAELDKNVTKILNQTKTEMRDGMDIAILKINFREKRVEYAGANRPLYHISNGKLNETKPTKLPIGGGETGKEKKFESVHLQLNAGDMIYLSTDGYADQFGGEKNKKLTTKKFKNMLESISGQNTEEQEKYLLESFNKFKGSSEQTDDVLVAGIRF